MTAMVFPNWKAAIAFSAAGPQPHILTENGKVKIILAGLEPGQSIPAHPEALAVYHFLEGTGWMIVDGEKIAVGAGTTIVTPEGSSRGVEAQTRLAFMATRIA